MRADEIADEARALVRHLEVEVDPAIDDAGKRAILETAMAVYTAKIGRDATLASFATMLNTIGKP